MDKPQPENHARLIVLNGLDVPGHYDLRAGRSCFTLGDGFLHIGNLDSETAYRITGTTGVGHTIQQLHPGTGRSLQGS